MRGGDLRLDLAAFRNEAARAAIRAGLHLAAGVFEREVRAQIAGFRADQERLRRAYGIEPATPILRWGDEVRASVEAFAARHPDARFAYTSGSTSTPKKIAFTRARLRAIKRGSFSVAARLVRALGVRRPALFILSGLAEDDSLSALLLGGGASLGRALVMPSKVLADPALAPLVREHGATAARVLALALADPGLIYSTNPSTLAVFLAEVHERWDESTALARRFLRAPIPALAAIVGRGWRARLGAIARARAPLPVERWLPSLEVYCCWDGGYVRPFLDEIARFLPAPRFRLVPMYSMSTETVETLTVFARDGTPRFLPLAPGVLYEFVPEGAPDRPEALVPAADLEPGRAYAMVVSDPYGLRRYQTDDLFLCAARVGDAPDLRFLRRRGLAYSFTGEKITGEQLTEAFDRLRAEVPGLAGTQLTCFPSQPAGELLPRYRLVVAHAGAAPPLDGVAARFDVLLGEANREFAAKRESGRLAPTVAEAVPYDALAARLDPKTRAAGDLAARPWDTQFKLLPLHARTWEEVMGDSARRIE